MHALQLNAALACAGDSLYAIYHRVAAIIRISMLRIIFARFIIINLDKSGTLVVLLSIFNVSGCFIS
jgi:hypothetical protein